jgi:hypothetical protein
MGLFYSQTLLGVTNLPQAWVHNLVSNASASGVTLLNTSLVGRVCIQNASATATAFPCLLDPLASNTLTVQMNTASTLTSCRVEVQFVHSIPS